MTNSTVAEQGSREASKRLADVLSPELIDRLLADVDTGVSPVDGVDGLLNQMTKAVLERAMEAEMTAHLGYEPGDPTGRGTGNSRNGKTTKTVATTNGPVEIVVPRDRDGSFTPKIVPKRVRRLGRIEDMILSLYSRGMTTRDITAHLSEVYGITASADLISRVTDVVVDEIKTWQSRPLDEVYPILYVDGIRVRVRDAGVVTTKTAYLAVGVDVEGYKQPLGIWIGDAESAKFWAKVCTDLRNRGVADILIACCDGLTGLPDAIRSAFPDVVVQTCVVHVVRNAMRFVSYGDRKKIAADMRAVYTAPTLEAAELAFTQFETKWGNQYPGTIQVWKNAWNDFTPFLDYPGELRRIVYTTNAIESINYQLRKITKTRGHFPDVDAAVKLVYLGLRNISPIRGGESGTGTHGWKRAMNILVTYFPGRLPM